MEQINKYRSSIVLGVLALFLILFAFFMLGVQPTNHEIAAQKNEIAQLEEQNALIQNKMNELQNSDMDSEQAAALAALPRGDSSEQLIRDFQSIGIKTKAKLKDVGFTLSDTNGIGAINGTEEPQYPTVKEIKMTGVVEGNYQQIHDWLQELNALPRLIQIDSFSFQLPYEQRSEKTPGSILTANVTFTAYYEVLKEAEAAKE
ncbi:type II secretion system protein GspM [Paenibacillus sp. BR2-3]|uniref:type II secretion system protein GspM n=1 Tax=Paenibacillus sp. BR2-3 TaxID=3048494 RepID=UPI003977A809